MLNGNIFKSPIVKFVLELKSFWLANSIFILWSGIACQVPLLAYTGILYFLESVPRPFIWSECSWVTKIALISVISTSILESAETIFFALSPASIKILVFGVSTYKLFPVLPLYKLQNLNIIFFFLCSILKLFEY